MSFSDDEVLRRIRAFPHWHQRIPIRPGIVTPGVQDSTKMLGMLKLPDDCRGLRALDVGTRDGFFAFELERRGADVVIVDYMPMERTGFPIAAELLGSRLRYQQENVYDLSPEKYGTFDIILFLGVLYHLPDPIQALQMMRQLCRGRMWVESHVIDNTVLLPNGKFISQHELSPVLTTLPLMQFFPGASLNNDASNYWGPNSCCLRAMLKECNFEVQHEQVNGSRAIVSCRITADERLAYHNRIARGLPAA
jgi:tRNA (mo5U34)-methyltransferase